MPEPSNVADALATARAFFAAIEAERWDEAARMIDVDSGETFRQRELSVLVRWAERRDSLAAMRAKGEGMVAFSTDGRLDLALAEKHGRTQLRGAPGIETLADLIALPLPDFLAKSLELTNTPHTLPSGELFARTRRVLGGVGEGEDMAHVLFRTEGPGIRHTDPHQVEVLRLERIDGAWRVELGIMNHNIIHTSALTMLPGADVGP